MEGWRKKKSRLIALQGYTDSNTQGSRVGTVFRVPTSWDFRLEINDTLQLFKETPENICEYRLKTWEICQKIVLENSYLFSQFSVMELSLRHFYRKMLTLSVGHVVCLLALVGGVSSCSNPGVVTLNDKTRYSDVIVTGSIESKVGDGKYSLTVDCVLKDSGADIPGALNISGVGKLGKYQHTCT